MSTFSVVAPASASRLAYIDWMRGLACVVMFQTHCYDSWLNPEARKTTFFMWSQIGGTLPAPLFLFLAGVSVALVIDKLRQKTWPPEKIARTVMTRGAEVLGLGIIFRVQEYVLAWGWSPWTDLFRVDVLNMIGLSIFLMGLSAWIVLALYRGQHARFALAVVAAVVAMAISLLTPLFWTAWRLRWLPWPLESYINGVHNLDKPQAWLFPVFPWMAFAFAGLAAGFLLLSEPARKWGAGMLVLVGVAGVALIYFSIWLDRGPWTLYSEYDYWHTSPNFFLTRVGILLIILLTAYLWCRWGAGGWGFSPLMQLGSTSLLVYWVHIEFVYGRFSILRKHQQSITKASLGLLTIFLAMLLLSILRTKFKRRMVLPWLQKQPA